MTRYVHRYPGLNVFDLANPVRDIADYLNMLAACQPYEHEVIDKLREKIEDQLDILHPLVNIKAKPEPLDMSRVTVTELGETEELDGDGTYSTYYLVEHEDYTAQLDIEGLKKEAQDRYEYHGGPGAYFCSRIAVWEHPYSSHRAIIEAVHQMDI